MTIDAHQHFWKYESERHAWIEESMSTIRRDFLPADLEKVYAEHDIDGCVAVQVDQTLAETDFLLDLAERYDFIKGVVGWADLCDKNVEEILEKYASRKKLKGWRHIVQGEPDPNFLLRSDFIRGVSYLGQYDYTYDILVYPHQLGAVLEFVKRFPHQKFAINHIAKPHIKDGYYEGWAVLMKEIALCENVSCKVSGMVTEADYHTWTPEQIQPYLHHILTVFGSERLMFGSDWPVCLVAGNYGQVKKVVTDFTSTLGSIDQNMIMGENAEAFYRL
ncbi:MAG TPA: amidohydrolase family protein [Pricia sp.]|nr:amidohydrolase family protein [Pricia sp.]